MTAEEVKSFTEFRRHQANFMTITKSQVLDIGTGKVTLHIANDAIKKIVIEKTIVSD